MIIKNKPTIFVGLTLSLLLIGITFYFLQFPLSGLERTLFYKACYITDCGQYHEHLKTFQKKLEKRDKYSLNALARAELFVNYYFQGKKQEPLNYVMTLRQYNRLVTKYKKLTANDKNLSDFKTDYNNFYHCHKNISAYYQKEESQTNLDLRKLELQLFSSSSLAEYKYFNEQFLNQENLKLPDLSPFQSSVLIIDRCLQKLDDIFNIQKFIATKGQTVNLRSIQKDIIQFETRFGTKYRERYKHLIHLDTKQYLDQSLSL